MTCSVKVLKAAQAEVPGPEVYWMSHWGAWETLYFYLVLIQDGDYTALVNTGPPADLEQLNAAWQAFAGERCRMIRSEEEKVTALLASAGVSPEQVDYLLLTPLQAYATANIPLFRNATICMSRRGWIEEIVARPSYGHVSRELCIPDEVLKYLMFEAQDRVRLLADKEEICPGIGAWWAGTHHRSSMVYTVDTASGPVMISDCAFKFGNVTGPPLGISESLAEGAAAYERIRSQAAHFIPLYDPEVLVRYPGGVVV